MLQVAVARFRELWPEARIQVITDAPDLVVRYCPGTQPLSARGRRIWFREPNLARRFNRLLPRSLCGNLQKFETELRLRQSSLAELMIRSKMKVKKIDTSPLDSFLEAIYEANLMVMAGAGALNDVFQSHAMGVLDVLAMAIRQGKFTAVFSQGLGPITGLELVRRCKQVLPCLNLITLRERKVGLPLLSSFGVAPDRVITTGDDAIELAYNARAKWLGEGLGVNLRVAYYSEVDQKLVDRIRPVLEAAATLHGAPMVPVTISRHPQESDDQALYHFFGERERLSDREQRLDTPSGVIRRIGGCRVLVTGSYHAAVFALAQGISVVGLAKSPYYAQKFLGLADLFGTGCKVVFLGDEAFRERLAPAIDSAWVAADCLRPSLLEAAERQIELSRASYRRVYEHFACRRAV
jgi:polysaccharide pyruvyl transferase WcaK-like protein